MIRVIRADGIEILLNTEFIQGVEGSKETPTIITLTTGEKIQVKTPAYDVVHKIKAFISGISQERREASGKPEKDKEKEKEKENQKDKEKGKDRDKDRDKDRGKDRYKDRGKDRGKDRYKDRGKDRDRGRGGPRPRRDK
jgi:uncharacterized protein YlzI (FlbEa/FlbD family)